MKTCMTIFAALFVWSNVFASEGDVKLGAVSTQNIAYSIYAVNNAEKIRFYFENRSGSPIRVEIYDADHSLLHTNSIDATQDEGALSYDLSEMGAGAYQVKIMTKGFSKSHDFVLGKRKKAGLFLPYIFFNKDKDKVHIVVKKDKSPLSIKMYDENGVVYYEDNVPAKKYHKVLNLSKLQSQKYYIAVGDFVQSITYRAAR